MKHTMKTLLGVLLALTMICGPLPGMRLTAYATTDTDVYHLIDNMQDLSYQKYQEDDIQAYRDLMQAYYDLIEAYDNAGAAVTPEVEAAYDSALAVYQQYSHIHSWGYQASGASVTATCTGNGDCDYKTNGVTLTISAPANLECDGNAKAAAISGEIPGGSGLLDPSNITYNPGGSTAPSTPGTYTASFIWGGATGSVEFTLTQATVKYPLWVGGTQVTEDSLSGEGWSYTPAVTEGGVTTPATLTLTDYSYEGEGHGEENTSGAIYAKEDLTIIANGNNTVTKTGTAGAGIYVDTNLTVGGSGTLSVTNDETNGVGISCNNVTIGGGTVKASGRLSGIFARNDITITGGTVDARSTSNTGKALQCFRVLRIESGTVDAAGGPNGNGVFGMAGVEIEGGSVIATGSDGAIYGTVKNAIPGVGWADAAGTEGKTRIPTSETGQKLTYLKAQFPAHEVTYKVANGTWSDGGTTDKTEPVASGSKPDSVPTGMKAAEGYEGGAWDTDPTGATITEATTFTYAFTAIPTHEVTYEVVGGTWSDGSTTTKKEAVRSGAKPASVPTGMKAAEGYEGGSWDTDPAEATITGATTFTYAFTAKGKPAATYKVSVSQAAGGTVSADKETAAEGETVAVTATPADGYELDAVTVDGEAIAGTSFAMPARDVTVSARFRRAGDEPATGALTLSGSGHVQTYGDEGATQETGGILIGTTGQSKRLEQFSVSLPEGTDGSIEYRGHVQGIGWDGWVADGAPCGTTGESRRIEAVQMTLSGNVAEDYSVWYRAHSQTFGWLGWARDGEAAGTAGQSKRAEAIEVQVLPNGQTPSDYAEGQASYIGAVTGDAHVQGTGWLGSGSALSFGTTGQSRRLEAISITTPNQPEAGGVSYEVHAQGIGWMGEVADGALAGTTGQSRRLEAVRVSLTGDMAADFSVWYRVHSQTYGWLGWAHDGQDAGTTGLSKRAEAIDVQILPQGQVPAGYDGSAACIVG